MICFAFSPRVLLSILLDGCSDESLEGNQHKAYNKCTYRYTYIGYYINAYYCFGNHWYLHTCTVNYMYLSGYVTK